MFYIAKIKKMVVVFMLLLLAGSLVAQDDGEGKRGPRRKLESWYHSFTLGVTPQTEVEGIKIESDVAIALDFLRFYWRTSRHMILGVGIYGTGLRNEATDSQLNFYLYSASMQYYPKSVGDGIFFRADVGIAKGVFVDSAGDYTASESGLGALIGAGYAIPISRETSLLLYGAYRIYEIEGLQYRDLSFQIGWLW